MARQLQMSDDDKTIIKQIMREKGITVEQLAERMGKARPTISNLLIKQNMTIDTLTAFADALEVEISDLFPVKPGYMHYLEIRNHVREFKSTSLQENKNLQDTDKRENKNGNIINTTAFCPNCGTKVKVGVVLIAE